MTNVQDDYLIDSNNELKPLIITFGGINGGIYQPLFEFKNFLQKYINCHFMFIRDTKQCWYHGGIIGFGKNINQVKLNIIKIIQTINYSKIITIGGSMGGYASLLFGQLINADGIIAFSPQTFIDQTNRKLYNDNRWSNQINSIYNKFDDTYYDLLKLNFDKSKVNIIYGNNDKLDKIHCERFLTKNNIKINSYSGGHNIVKYLRDSGILIKIINKFIID